MAVQYQRFTSAGGENEWETFALTDPADDLLYITAVEGPTIANYPALRVADFQLVGELIITPGVFNVR